MDFDLRDSRDTVLFQKPKIAVSSERFQAELSEIASLPIQDLQNVVSRLQLMGNPVDL